MRRRLRHPQQPLASPNSSRIPTKSLQLRHRKPRKAPHHSRSHRPLPHSLSRHSPTRSLSPQAARRSDRLCFDLQSSSYEQPVDQPTDNSESAAVPSPTPSKAEENWTPPPSSTTEEEKPSPTPTPQTQQQMAESSPSATSGNWGEDSTNQQQQQQPSQTYESTSENWVANAVESEAVTNLTTSSIYQEAGTARTSTWVYSTTYSMVKSPVRTVTASGKVGTKVAVVAGSSTATTLTATGSTNPTSYASNSSDGSLSKGGIAGTCHLPLRPADMQRCCCRLSRRRRGDSSTIVLLLRT